MVYRVVELSSGSETNCRLTQILFNFHFQIYSPLVFHAIDVIMPTFIYRFPIVFNSNLFDDFRSKCPREINSNINVISILLYFTRNRQQEFGHFPFRMNYKWNINKQNENNYQKLEKYFDDRSKLRGRQRRLFSVNCSDISQFVRRHHWINAGCQSTYRHLLNENIILDY